MDEKERQCIDDCMGYSTEYHQIKMLGLVAILVFGIVGLFIWAAPYFFIDDTMAIYRYMILKIPTMLLDVFVLIFSLVLFDFIGKEKVISNISKDPMSASVLYSALLVAMGIAIAFG